MMVVGDNGDMMQESSAESDMDDHVRKDVVGRQIFTRLQLYLKILAVNRLVIEKKLVAEVLMVLKRKKIQEGKPLSAFGIGVDGAVNYEAIIYGTT